MSVEENEARFREMVRRLGVVSGADPLADMTGFIESLRLLGRKRLSGRVRRELREQLAGLMMQDVIRRWSVGELGLLDAEEEYAALAGGNDELLDSFYVATAMKLFDSFLHDKATDVQVLVQLSKVRNAVVRRELQKQVREHALAKNASEFGKCG
ncbi:MAG: hypothetical protein JW834_01740 [Candidatus Diapherotrites archaeon]|nr:hypothetical protein [Candidatus Diapherotrites archaeon]